MKKKISFGFNKVKLNEGKRIKFAHNKINALKDNDEGIGFYNQNQPPKTSYANSSISNQIKESIIPNSTHFRRIESTALEQAMESLGTRFTFNPDLNNIVVHKEDNENKKYAGRNNIPDGSKKMIQDHINEYRKIHNKLIDNQLENYISEQHKKNPIFLEGEKKFQYLKEEEDFRPMTSAFNDPNIKQIIMEKETPFEKPKSAYQVKRNFKHQQEGGCNSKIERPESRYKKESLCAPLSKEREKSPDYKVPIEKMDYDTYKKSNAILPSCWN